MAQTWTAYFSQVAFANGKSMAGILNSHASEVLTIYRVGLLNSQTSAVTGVLCELLLRSYRGTATYTGSTAVTPVAHDSTNVAPTTATYGHNGTPGGSTNSLLRRVMWSNDEPAFSSATSDEFECIVPWNIIWDAGYGDTNVQGFALRTTELMVLINNTNTTVGVLDTWMEFTKS